MKQKLIDILTELQPLGVACDEGTIDIMDAMHGARLESKFEEYAYQAVKTGELTMDEVNNLIKDYAPNFYNEEEY